MSERAPIDALAMFMQLFLKILELVGQQTNKGDVDKQQQFNADVKALYEKCITPGTAENQRIVNWLKDNEPPFDMVRVAELTTELARDGNINIPDLSKTNLEALQEHVKVLADVVHARERGGPAGLDERTGPPGSDITLNV